MWGRKKNRQGKTEANKKNFRHIFLRQKCGFPAGPVRQVGRNRSMRSSHFQPVSAKTNFRGVGGRVLECEYALESLQYPFRLRDPEG